MKIAYFDCSAGISGDMCLGAIVDAGVPLKRIENGLKALPIKGYRLEAKKVKRAGIAATKVDVIVQKSSASGGGKSQKSESKKWKDIERIIRISSLSDDIKEKGLKIFKTLFEVEGRVHGTQYNKTHLHELGAVDCIIDIFGTLIGLDLLGIDKVYSSALNLGSGSVITEHGRLPVPAPATAEILKGIPVYSSDIPFELTTPTGAAIVRGIADDYIRIPLMKILKIGYGAGQRDIKAFPNILRIFLGEDVSISNSRRMQKITVIETNIDDMNPQLYEHIMERLFDAGVLDVYLSQVIMKKGRPGVILTVLCQESKRADIINILFRETTTIGLRFYEASRVVLERELREVETPLGKIKVKISIMNDGTVKFNPEYEDCKRISKKCKIPLIKVMSEVVKLKP